MKTPSKEQEPREANLRGIQRDGATRTNRRGNTLNKLESSAGPRLREGNEAHRGEAPGALEEGGAVCTIMSTSPSYPTKRLRFLLDRTTSSERQLLAVRSSTVTFLPMEAIGETGELDVSSSRELEDVRTGYSVFKDGDVVVAKITPCFENGKGAVILGTLSGIGFGTTELHVLTPGTVLDSRFLYYITASPEFRRRGAALMTGAAGQQRVPEDFIRDFPVVALPLERQQAIVRFLDQELSRLDNVVAAKSRQVELLAEKRKAIIASAVTRGIDPQAKLRDSGVPWLGEIPEHWRFGRIKHLCRAMGGGTPDKGKPEYWQGDIPWVSPKDMKIRRIRDSEDHITDEGLANSATQMVPPNSVLLVMRSGILRHSVPVAINEVPVALNQDMRAFLPDCNLLPEYLAWLIEGHQALLLQAWSKVGTTVESLETDLVGDTLIPVPPIDEQLSIVSHIARETTKLDDIRAATERTIALLKERRAVLISAAVTGQIDVT